MVLREAKTNVTGVKIKGNEIKNRLYLVLEGSPSTAQLLSQKGILLEEINKCHTGFTVLTFFNNFTPSSEEVFKVIMTFMKIIQSAGVSKVARVSSGSHLLLKKIDQLSKLYGGYPARSFTAFEEAEDYLDGIDNK